MTTNLTSYTHCPVHVDCQERDVKTSLTTISDADDLIVYDFQVRCEAPKFPKPISLRWKFPGKNVKGVWKPSTDFSKRIQADWELKPMESRISVDAPILSVFGHDDVNVLTIACNDAINTLELDAVLREEDNHIYCEIVIFSKPERAITAYDLQIRLDFRDVHFSRSLQDVSPWWETFEELRPIAVPDIARRPVYSTWYQFHQNLDQETLLNECRIAAELGYCSIIIDDGWQTIDSNRGYDFTGDWQPDRIDDMASFVEKIHSLGMQVAIWYSVPFCGVKSKAYQKFKGKFLTEDHRWAPVFDPRYPEVRDHLIGLYTNAMREWNLDGFKLDFIDDFRLYEDTPMGAKDGRDYASINQAVDRLLSDVMFELQQINPTAFIEFRQKYTGPAMRKYGNMFRAFDCPGDAVMNRIRIADLRMYCGNTAIHADMITWHPSESVEVAALQLTNIMFGVPQLSVTLQDCREDELNMIRFYTHYWNRHSDVLTKGQFKATRPLANYPLQQVVTDRYTIIGVHDDYVVPISSSTDHIHVLNAQLASEIVLRCSDDFGEFRASVFDCQGRIHLESEVILSKGLHRLEVPACGMIQFERIATS